MSANGSRVRGYVVATALGAAAGGIAVALATRAIPVIFSRVMSNMMEGMMARMGGEACNPEDI